MTMTKIKIQKDKTGFPIKIKNSVDIDYRENVLEPELSEEEF